MASASRPRCRIPTPRRRASSRAASTPATFNSDVEKFGTNLWQINYGFMPNLQGYISVPLIIGEGRQNTNGNTNWELLYRLNDETDSMPSFGVEGIANAPTGGKNTGWNGTGSLVISKSFGAWRGHFNGGYTTIGKDGSLPVFGSTFWTPAANTTSYVDTYLLGVDYACRTTCSSSPISSRRGLLSVAIREPTWPSLAFVTASPTLTSSAPALA